MTKPVTGDETVVGRWVWPYPRSGHDRRIAASPLHPLAIEIDGCARRGLRGRHGLPGRNGRLLVRTERAVAGPGRGRRRPASVFRPRARLSSGILTPPVIAASFLGSRLLLQEALR